MAGAVALEVTDSPNTMAILAIVATGMGLTFGGQILSILQGRAAATASQDAKAVALDTHQQVTKISSAVNGELDARLRAAATAAIAAVLDDRDQHLDERIERVVLRVLDTHTVSCKVPERGEGQS